MAVWSSTTFGEAKLKVARALSFKRDPDVVEAAGDVIRDICREWNRHCWRFFQISTSLNLTSGTTEYELPTNFKSPYSARLVTSGRTLRYVDQKTFDRADSYDHSLDTILQEEPSAYLVYERSTVPDGEDEEDYPKMSFLQLLPGNSLTETLTVRYYRGIVLPTLDSDILDIPDAYEVALLDGARARLAAEKGDERALAFWESKAQTGYRLAVGDDSYVPDEDIRPVSHETETYNRWSY